MVRGEDDTDDTDEEQKQHLARLDERFLRNPGLALEQTSYVVEQMANDTKESIRLATELLWNYSKEKADLVAKLEGRVDIYEDRIGSYLLRINSKDMTVKEVDTHGLLLKCIGDLERMSDHAMNIMEAAQEKQEKGEVFSTAVSSEMRVFVNAVQDVVDMATEALCTRDIQLAHSIEPIEEAVDSISHQMKERRVLYLASGECSPVIGFILSDLNIDLERIGDHCSNIGATLIEVGKNDFDMHEYLDHELKESNNAEFEQKVKEAKAKYSLPEAAVSKRKRSSQVPTRADTYEYEGSEENNAYVKPEKKTEATRLTDDDDAQIPEIHD